MATRSRPRTFISTPSTTFESRGSERIDVCNLYSLNKNRDTVGRFFRVSHNRIVSFEPSWGIFPRHVATVVCRAADGEREIVLMNWGFFRLEKGRAPKPVTNVRDDQIQTNPFWRDSFKQRRCLVPAGAFCEPNGDGHVALVRDTRRWRAAVVRVSWYLAAV